MWISCKSHPTVYPYHIGSVVVGRIFIVRDLGLLFDKFFFFIMFIILSAITVGIHYIIFL